MDHFYRKLPWEMMNYEDLYSDMVRRFPSGVFVEVGSWMGASAAFMAVEIINSGKPIQLHCVDHWKGSEAEPVLQNFLKTVDGYEVFKHNMKPVWDRIHVHRMPSTEAALKFLDASVDFVFIDASHTYDDCLADIKAWLPKVKPGGVIAGHDFDWTFMGVVHAVRDVFYSDYRVQGNCWIHEVKAAG